MAAIVQSTFWNGDGDGWIVIKMSKKIVPKGPIYDKPSLVQMMW